MSKHYKVVLVGDSKVGKTAFIKRHLTGNFETKFNTTIGVEVHNLRFNTNRGQVVFNLWDCAGNPKFSGLGDGYYYGLDAAIIMFDVTDKRSYRNVEKWYDAIRNISADVPIVICGNKVDEHIHQVKARHINFHRKKKLQYYNISARTGYRLDKPFLGLTKKLLKTYDVKFTPWSCWV